MTTPCDQTLDLSQSVWTPQSPGPSLLIKTPPDSPSTLQGVWPIPCAAAEGVTESWDDCEDEPPQVMTLEFQNNVKAAVLHLLNIALYEY